jgi:ubiquinone/menaquinone biosynthesis C-methylase UbiE
MEDVEKLGYYDFMVYMEIPFFNIGGQVSIDSLAELCKVNKNSKVLEVGCGTGANACYLAEKFGCTVVGVDISEYMVNYAIQRAINSGPKDIVSFKVGNAYNLDFSDNIFDVVLTVFLSQFLDPNKAFQEFL